MLDENEVTEAISLYLLDRGYAILQKSTTDRRGVDIVAYHPESKAKIFISVAGVAHSKAGRGKPRRPIRNPRCCGVWRGVYTAR